ncbi:hypothetical protein D3C84_1125790 [compost metagenome]
MGDPCEVFRGCGLRGREAGSKDRSLRQLLQARALSGCYWVLFAGEKKALQRKTFLDFGARRGLEE